MRASDRERQRAVDELRRHCAAGRIDFDEYAARIERALAAATVEEIDQLLSDLPMIRIADPAGVDAGRGRSGGWGSAPRSRFGGSEGDMGSEPSRSSLSKRLSATAVAMISVAVVVTVVVMALVAEWAWAAILLAGWLTGVVQGRLRR
jgi:hypothetical protein